MEKYKVVPVHDHLWAISDAPERHSILAAFTTEEAALDLCAAMNFGAELRTIKPDTQTFRERCEQALASGDPWKVSDEVKQALESAPDGKMVSVDETAQWFQEQQAKENERLLKVVTPPAGSEIDIDDYLTDPPKESPKRGREFI